MKNASYFTLKALFALKMLKFFSCFFGHVEKFQNLRRHNLASKQMQVTYCPISQEITAITQ